MRTTPNQKGCRCVELSGALIVSVASAGLEKMFLEVGQPVTFGQRAPPPSKAEIDKWLAVAPSYGIEIRLPQY